MTQITTDGGKPITIRDLQKALSLPLIERTPMQHYIIQQAANLWFVKCLLDQKEPKL